MNFCSVDCFVGCGLFVLVVLELFLEFVFGVVLNGVVLKIWLVMFGFWEESFGFVGFGWCFDGEFVVLVMRLV